MKTALEKILFLTMNTLCDPKGHLVSKDIMTLFERHPEIKDYLLDEVWAMPVTVTRTNQERQAILHIPVVNVFFLTIKDQNLEMRETVWELLKHDIEPFKEVFLEMDNQKELLHGLDLFTINFKPIRDLAENKISLKIQNLNQFYNFVKKNTLKNIFKVDFNMQSWNYDTHIKFNVNFESFFLDNWDKTPPENIVISFDSVRNQYVNLQKPMNVSLGKLNGADPAQMDTISYFLKHKLKQGEIDFVWDTEKVTTLLSNNNIIVNDSEYLFGFLCALSQEQDISEEMLSMVMIKNRSVFEKLNNYLETNNISPRKIIDISPQPEVVNDMEKIEQWIMTYAVSDPQVIGYCQKIAKVLEFLSSPKSLPYFAENIEEKILLDKTINRYLPQVVDTYFALPEDTRKNPSRQFLSMTLEQLAQIHQCVETMECDVLENEMRKMRVFGKFLNERLPSEQTLIKLP